MGSYADELKAAQGAVDLEISNEDAVIREQNTRDDSAFTRGAKRGFHGLVGTVHGLRGAVNSLTGDKVARDAAFRDYQARQRTAGQFKKETTLMGDEGTQSALQAPGTFLAETLGEAVPSLAEFVATGAAGAAIGSQAVPGVGPEDVVAAPVGFLAGVFAKGAIKKKLASMGMAYATRQLVKEGGKELAEQTLKKMGKAQFANWGAKQLGGRVGSFAALTAIAGGQEGGGNWAELYEKGIDAPGSSLAMGVLSGASESLLGATPGMMKVFQRPSIAGVLKRVNDTKGVGAAAGVLWDMAKQGGEEGLQEGVQELLSMINMDINDPDHEWTKESFKQLVESAAAGAVVGGVTGGAGGVRQQVGQRFGRQTPDAGPEVSDEEVESVMQNMEPPEKVAAISRLMARSQEEFTRFADRNAEIFEDPEFQAENADIMELVSEYIGNEDRHGLGAATSELKTRVLEFQTRPVDQVQGVQQEHTMPDGTVMAGPEHEGAVPGSTREVQEVGIEQEPEALPTPEDKRQQNRQALIDSQGDQVQRMLDEAAQQQETKTQAVDTKKQGKRIDKSLDELDKASDATKAMNDEDFVANNQELISEIQEAIAGDQAGLVVEKVNLLKKKMRNFATRERRKKSRPYTPPQTDGTTQPTEDRELSQEEMLDFLGAKPGKYELPDVEGDAGPQLSNQEVLDALGAQQQPAFGTSFDFGANVEAEEQAPTPTEIINASGTSAYRDAWDYVLRGVNKEDNDNYREFINKKGNKAFQAKKADPNPLSIDQFIQEIGEGDDAAAQLVKRMETVTSDQYAILDALLEAHREHIKSETKKERTEAPGEGFYDEVSDFANNMRETLTYHEDPTTKAQELENNAIETAEYIQLRILDQDIDPDDALNTLTRAIESMSESNPTKAQEMRMLEAQEGFVSDIAGNVVGVDEDGNPIYREQASDEEELEKFTPPRTDSGLTTPAEKVAPVDLGAKPEPKKKAPKAEAIKAKVKAKREAKKVEKTDSIDEFAKLLLDPEVAAKSLDKPSLFKKMAEARNAITDYLKSEEKPRIFKSENNTYYLHKATRPGVEWQLSTFTKDEQPLGHTEYKNYDQAIDDLTSVGVSRKIQAEHILEREPSKAEPKPKEGELFAEGDPYERAINIASQIRNTFKRHTRPSTKGMLAENHALNVAEQMQAKIADKRIKPLQAEKLLEQAMSDAEKFAKETKKPAQLQEETLFDITPDDELNLGDTAFAEPAKQKVAPKTKGDASLSRKKTTHEIEFKNPIIGENGNKITSYRWNWTDGEKWSNREEGLVEAKISDWETSLTNPETGREIVHWFTVVSPDGNIDVVSAESAAKMLGITTSKVRSKSKSEVKKFVEQGKKEESEKKALDEVLATTGHKKPVNTFIESLVFFRKKRWDKFVEYKKGNIDPSKISASLESEGKTSELFLVDEDGLHHHTFESAHPGYEMKRFSWDELYDMLDSKPLTKAEEIKAKVKAKKEAESKKPSEKVTDVTEKVNPFADLKELDEIKFNRGGRDYTRDIIKVLPNGQYLVELFGNKYIKPSEVIRARKKGGEIVEAESKSEKPKAHKAEAIKEKVKAKKATVIDNVKSYDAVIKRIRTGDITADELRAAFKSFTENRQVFVDFLQSKTKAQIARASGQYRDDSTKPTMIRIAVDRFAQEFVPRAASMSGLVSYHGGMLGESTTDVVNRQIKDITDADLAKIQEKTKEVRAKQAEEKQARLDAVKDPKTLSDFRIALDEGVELTEEQQARYDDLATAARRERTKERKEAQRERLTAPVGDVGMSIVEAYHDKKDIPMFVVQQEKRVERDEFIRLKAIAKANGGYYSPYRGGRAKPGFQFTSQEDAQTFIDNAIGEESTATKEAVPEKTGAEKLKETSARLMERAVEKRDQDRRTNTARQAGMAASSIADAERDIAIATTMQNIAESIEDDTAVHLRGLRDKTQVETIMSIMNRAKRDYVLENNISSVSKEYRELPAWSPKYMEFVKYPEYQMHAESINRFANELDKTKGAKLVANRLRKIYKGLDPEKNQMYTFDSVRDLEIIDKMKKKLKGEHIMWLIDNDSANIGRLNRMDVLNTQELRAALREYASLKEDAKGEDPIKKLERDIKTDKFEGLDFFPTPIPLANRMVEMADIEPGMKVLEPSAGKGDIAKSIQDAHPDADVTAVEVSGKLREIIKAKGLNLSDDRDFLEHEGEYDRIVMNPPFSKNKDVEHVRHAYSLLKPGGKIIAIVSEHPFFANDKVSKEFREWFGEVGVSDEKMQDAFKGKDAFRQTGVNTRLIEIEKPSSGVKFSVDDQGISRTPITSENVQESFPGAEVTNDGDDYTVALPSGAKFNITMTKSIPTVVSSIMRDYGVTREVAQRMAMSGAKGATVPSGATVELSDGKTLSIDEINVIIQESRGDSGTVRHEGLHVAKQLGFFDSAYGKSLWDSLMLEYGSEENIANAREVWTGQNGLWGKIVQWFQRLKLKLGMEINPNAALNETFTEQFWSQGVDRSGVSNIRFSADPVTSIKNDVVDDLREQRRAGEITAVEAESQQMWLDHAETALNNDFTAGARLLNELTKESRVLSDRETAILQVHYRREYNVFEQLSDKLFEAQDSGDAGSIAIAQTAVNNQLVTVNGIEEVTRSAGREWGRAGVARQIALKKDFSLAGMERKARVANGGKALNKEQMQEIKKLSETVERLEKRILEESSKVSDLEKQAIIRTRLDEEIAIDRKRPKKKMSKASTGFAMKAKDILKGLGFSALKEKVESVKFKIDEDADADIEAEPLIIEELYDTAVEMAKAYNKDGITSLGAFIAAIRRDVGDVTEAELTFAKAWNDMALKAKDKTISGGELDITDPKSIIKEARNIQRELVEQGITDQDAIIDAVHETLKESIPDMSRSEAVDALSGYGQFSTPSKNEIDIAIRELNALHLQVSKQTVLNEAIAKAEELREEGLSDDEIAKRLVDEGLQLKATGYVRGTQTDLVRHMIAQTNELKKELPVLPTAKEGQLQSALDAAKKTTRNRIKDLQWEISNKERIVKVRKSLQADKELEALRKERDELVAEHRQMFPAKTRTEAQRIAAAESALDKAIARTEREILSGDIGVKKVQKVSTPAIDAKRARLDELKAQKQALRDIANPKMTPEQRALKNYEANILRRVADYQDRIAEKDFAPRKKEARELSDAELKLKKRLEDAKIQFMQKSDAYRRANLSLPGKALDYAKEIGHISRSLMTSMDLSAVFRQGGIAVYSHPALAKEASKEMFKALVSEQNEFNSAEKMRQHQLWQKSQTAKLAITTNEGQITKQEESFMGRWADRVPGVAGSGRAYTTFLNSMRFNLFVTMVDSIGKNGQVTTDEAKVIANYINAATGRADFKRLNESAATLNSVFFAPRYVASRFQYLTLPFALPWMKTTPRVKKMIAQEYARTFAGAAVFIGSLLTLAAITADGEEEEPTFEIDPRSTDFMKIKISDTRLDPLAGLSQVIVFSSKVLSGQTKSATSGKVKSLSDVGGSPFAQTRWSITGRFLRGKLGPIPGATVTTLNDFTDVVGQKHSPAGLTAGLFIPLSVREVRDSIVARGYSKGTAISMMALFGMGVGSYGKRTEYLASTKEERAKLFAKDLKKVNREDKHLPYQDKLTREQLKRYDRAKRRKRKAKKEDVKKKPWQK